MTATRTYLDYNATAPLRPEARAAMIAALDVVGNPSSVHAEGRRARAIIETAREQVAALVGAKPSEVVFTSGATEANNCVMAAGGRPSACPAIEHDSVLAPARASGAKVIALPAGGRRRRSAERRRAAGTSGIRWRARLLSVMMANNETGVIQPVAEVAALAREHGLSLHVDAVQAPGRLPVDFAELGVDTLVISAHKLGGPQGVGALVIRDGVDLLPLIQGGGQERRRRAGTENVAASPALARRRQKSRAKRTRWPHAGAARQARGRRHGGDAERGHRRPRGSAPRQHDVLAVPGKPAETLVIRLDLAGIAVSAGAACSSGKVGASSVLEAMGLGADIARSAVRVSLGPQTSEDDIAAFLAAWKKIAGRAALAA